MKAYFKFELSQFIKSKKNIAIYVLLLFLACFYALNIAPSYKPIEKVDAKEIEARYLSREAFLSNFTNENRFTGMAGYGLAIYPKWNWLDKSRLDALNDNKLKQYSKFTSEWYIYSNNITYGSEHFFYSPGYYTHGNLYASEDGYYGYLYSASRYQGYAEGKSKLSINVFEERTALQTLQRLLHSYLPMILMICCVFLTVDVVLKDRLNPSLLKGFPISDWKKLIIKGAVSLIGSIGVIVPLSVGLLLIGIRYGFGDFQLPVPIYSYSGEPSYFNKGEFINITMGSYLLENFILLIFCFMFLISLVLLVSMIIKNEFANLLVAAIFIFNEIFYFKRGIGFFYEVENYPTNYVQVGQILSGYRNYIYNSSALNLGNGLTALGMGTGVLLLLIFLISKYKRYKLV
ncbi:ABC transporter permease subunit [Ureibacillus acetophenoni]|uniref:ABC-2 type transport system permease protein n=1 Tax=Ureibacillus acetophenoni TaxID=614649 RepID=A0A285U6M6_9BACL|nr:ABC transporter permease subunit [Ureibacillus acetophenoni]SOC37383.1 ABC-2 type transport system permease protein [Ureibacillus acetophenoni]